MADYIDVTPAWKEILPTWLMLYREAVLGNVTNPDLIKANARAEFERMAEAADHWNAHGEFLKAIQQFTMGELTNAGFIDAILQAERNMLAKEG